jgi:peptide deformylase
MMTLDDIVLLGDPRLYQVCAPVLEEELPDLEPIIAQLAGVVLAFRQKYGAGRAIAAPQLGIMKRLVVMNIDHPIAIINPVLSHCSDEMMELWDDCMSFPNLLVYLRRHRRCTMTFRDIHWQEQVWQLEDGLSELMQHEIDHLDGILATQRASGDQAFKYRIP